MCRIRILYRHWLTGEYDGKTVEYYEFPVDWAPNGSDKLPSGTTMVDVKRFNYLNGEGIYTAVNWDGGMKSWGGRMSVYPSNTDPKDCQDAIRGNHRNNNCYNYYNSYHHNNCNLCGNDDYHRRTADYNCYRGYYCHHHNCSNHYNNDCCYNHHYRRTYCNDYRSNYHYCRSNNYYYCGNQHQCRSDNHQHQCNNHYCNRI